MNPLGGVQRLGTYFFAYSFTSQTLITNAQNMVACMVVKSSVDCKEMDDNTLRVIVNDSFVTLNNAQVAALYELLAEIVLPTPPTQAQIEATTALEKLYISMQSNPQTRAQLNDFVHWQSQEKDQTPAVLPATGIPPAADLPVGPPGRSAATAV